TTLSAVLFTGS
ncbi:hypothetical protein AB1N83_004775, partial [Pleurotus pulmonarius]